MSGCSCFNALLSIRELVTVFNMAFVYPPPGVYLTTTQTIINQQDKKSPGRMYPGRLVYLFCFNNSDISTSGKMRIHIIMNIYQPPCYWNRKRFVAVDFVYCAAISGISFFSAVVSIRLLCTALYVALCSFPVNISVLCSSIYRFISSFKPSIIGLFLPAILCIVPTLKT